MAESKSEPQSDAAGAAAGGQGAEADGKKEEALQEKAPKSVMYHKLFKYASALDLALFLFGLANAVGQGFCQVFMVVLFADMMDELMAQEFEATLKIIRYFCYLGVAVFFTGWFMFLSCNAAAEKQKVKLRVAYLNAVIHQDVSWFDTHTPATLPDRISSNVEKIALGMGDKAGNLVMDISMLFTGLFCALYFWWKLTLVIIAIIPFMGLGAALMGKAVTDLQNENQTWYGTAGSCAEEVMRALRTVISCRGEQLECDRYYGYLVHARRGGIIAQAKVGAGMGYMLAVMFASYGVAFWFSAFLIKEGETQPNGEPFLGAEVLKVFFCVLFGGYALGLMGEPIQAISSACAAAAHLYEVLETKPSIELPSKSDSAIKVTGIESISFQQVHFCYPARPGVKVLNGATLSMKAGQKVALVGESGSGKSTIISLIERFYDPSEGAILVNGMDIRTLSPNSLRAAMGYVGQEPVLFATSILANIMHGNPDATKADLEEVQRQAQLEFVGAMEKGLETFVGSGGSQFSGGQKQRIALARALIKKPSLLLLDEATSALDNKSEKMVQATLDQLGRDSAKALTTIEVAHRLSTVKDRDVIFVMQRGCVVEQGTNDELMALQGVYYSLVASQSSGLARQDSGGMVRQDSGRSRPPGNGAAPAEMMASGDEKDSGDKLEGRMEIVDADALEKKRQEEILKTYSAPLGRIMGFCRPEWIYLLPGMIGAVLNGAKEPLLGYVIFKAIVPFYWEDKEKMYKEVSWDAWYFITIAAFAFIGTFIQFISFGIMKEGLTLRMRCATMKHLMRMEVGYHDDPDHTPSKNVFALEMYAFRAGNLMTAFGAYANVFGALVVGLGLGFITSWRMSLMMLGAIPFIAISEYMATIAMMASGAGTSTEELKTAQQVVSDSLNSIRTVRALGVEDTLVSLVGQWSNPVANRAIKKGVTGGMNYGLSQALTYFVFAFAFWWAFWIIDNDHNTFQEVMQATGCIIFGSMGMGQAMSIVANLSLAKIACHDLFKLLDRKSLIDGIEPAGETPASHAAVGRIEFRDVKFSYPFRQDVQVLKGVSFTISAGQSVGLCGPSGGGKSTVLAMLQRFYDPQEGAILVTDLALPLSGVNIAWWRSQMGYIGQEPILFDTTVRENVLYGMDASKVSSEHLEKCGQLACLGFLKEQDGWETKVGPKGERLSGGQKQRVAICRAIVREPQIMLLDEATSALDSASEQVVQEALNNVLVGRTSITIAHRLSTIEKSDAILVCAEGRIVEAGTHAELMARRGVYMKLQNASHK